MDTSVEPNKISAEIPAEQPIPETSPTGKSNFVTGLIAFGIIMAACYFAASVIQIVLVSVILAIFLEPIVALMERIHIPRALSALLGVLTLAAVIALASVSLYNRVQDFAEEIPRYSNTIREAVIQVRRRIDRIQKQTEQVIPRSQERIQTVTVSEPSLLSRYLFPGVQTAASILMTIGFVPFLVFFMLTGKDHLYHSAVELFAEKDQPGVASGLRGIASMMRGYLVGNILVGLILSGASTALFLAFELNYPIILGLSSGFLTLIPYLGIPIAIVGPILVALGKYHSMAPYLVLSGSLVGLHIIGLNLLFPKIVGSRVNLNPVAVTLSLLVWGWMWGAMGFLLAIPITAGAKAVCDNIQGMQKFGRLLGE